MKSMKNKYFLRREHLNLNPTPQKPMAPFDNTVVRRSSKKEESQGKLSCLLPAPASDKAMTLVLDLDETLVHFESKEKKFKIRPGCVQFLAEVASNFEVVIFTAALKDYADYILNHLEKMAASQLGTEGKLFDHRLYRNSCELDDGVYVKDLRLLGRDLSKVVIVDNIRDNFERQAKNGIEILTWLSDPKDREL